jgi:hypothetical protein
MLLELFTDFQRAADWRFGASAEHKGATIAGRQAQQFPFGFSQAELLGAAHDFSQRLHLLALLVYEQLRVADDVDEQNVSYLEFHI